MMRDRLAYKYFAQEHADLMRGGRHLLRMLECFEQSAFFISDIQGRHIPCPYLVFSHEITPFLTQKTDHTIMNLIFLDLNHDTEILDTKKYNLSWEEGIADLESLLDQGEYVVLNTDQTKLKFHIYYTEEPDKAAAHHALLIVGHDKDTLKFVEYPGMIRKEGYVAYEKNPLIGIAKKEEMKVSCHYWLSFSTVHLKEMPREYRKNKLKRIIGHSIRNYHETARDDSLEKQYPVIRDLNVRYNESQKFSAPLVYSYGREAFLRIEEVFCNQFAQYQQIIANTPETAIHFFMNKMFDLRFIMLQALLENRDCFSPHELEPVTETFNENIHDMMLLWACMNKQFLLGETVISENIKGYIKKMIVLEEKMMKELESLRVLE